MGKLKNKVCIVTGGAQGIGLAIVRRLVNEEATVILMDIQEEKTIKLKELENEYPECIKYIKCDVSDENDVANAFEKINNWGERIDVLVNNAAIFIMKGLEATSDEINKINAVNILGVNLITKYTIDKMKKEGGSIVNISSISGLIGQSSFGIYNATKFAVRGLTKCWAIDLGKYNIRVNAVCPGYITSDSSSAYMKENDLPDEIINRRLKAMIPLSRFGLPADIASAVLFLASDDSSYVTGTDMVIDGGFTIQ